VLELQAGAPVEDVKRAYRDLLKVWHPDRFPNDPTFQRRATEKTQAINNAFQQLSAHLSGTCTEFRAAARARAAAEAARRAEEEARARVREEAARRAGAEAQERARQESQLRARQRREAEEQARRQEEARAHPDGLGVPGHAHPPAANEPRAPGAPARARSPLTPHGTARKPQRQQPEEKKNWPLAIALLLVACNVILLIELPKKPSWLTGPIVVAFLVTHQALARVDRERRHRIAIGIGLPASLFLLLNIAGYHDRAFGRLKSAAEAGDRAAQRSVGQAYEYGQSAEQSDAEAARWYSKAAEQGDAWAQARLGWTSDQGKGVPQNYEQAARWYRCAALQGDAMAQNNFGVRCEAGQGVPRDAVEAYKWYCLAAAQGEAYGVTNRDRLLPYLTPEQLADGQRRAAEFKATNQVSR